MTDLCRLCKKRVIYADGMLFFLQYGSRETIMRLEKAQYNPSLKLAIDISRAVEVPIEEIFIISE